MKSSAIMVRSALPLRMLDAFELEILSRVLFQYFRGLDATHNARWRRLWGRLFQRDEVLQFYPVVDRSAKFHRMVMAAERNVFEGQEVFSQVKAFRNWLKTGACFGAFEASGGQLVFVPSSVSFEECSDDEMREYFEDMVAFLRTERAQSALWPHLSPDAGRETVEALLKGPDDEADA